MGNCRTHSSPSFVFFVVFRGIHVVVLIVFVAVLMIRVPLIIVIHLGGCSGDLTEGPGKLLALDLAGLAPVLAHFVLALEAMNMSFLDVVPLERRGISKM